MNHIKLIKDVLADAGISSGMTETDLGWMICQYWLKATTEQVEDLGCFIQMFRERYKTPIWIAANVCHDLNGIIEDKPCFEPRSAGFADKYRREAVQP